MYGVLEKYSQEIVINGIVSDSATGLQWQDNEVGPMTTWQGAIDRCEALTLGPHSDWRLPNNNELKSIIDRSKVNPAIKDGFSHTISRVYWRATRTLRGLSVS